MKGKVLSGKLIKVDTESGILCIEQKNQDDRPFSVEQQIGGFKLSDQDYKNLLGCQVDVITVDDKIQNIVDVTPE